MEIGSEKQLGLADFLQNMVRASASGNLGRQNLSMGIGSDNLNASVNGHRGSGNMFGIDSGSIKKAINDRDMLELYYKKNDISNVGFRNVRPQQKVGLQWTRAI